MPASARPAPATRPAAPIDHLNAAVRDRPFLVSAAAAVLTGLLALGLFTPHYETNDDVTMNLIAAGVAFADRPDEHLVFSNVAIGLPLKWLYLAAPRAPWYGMYQFATVVAAAAALTYALLRVNPTRRQAAVAALFLGVAVLPCLAEIQFTRTAFLASFAGLALLLAPLRGATPWPRTADAAGCVLLILGSLIRFESFLLAGVVALPLAAVAAYAAPRRALWRAAPVGASLAVAIALYFLNLAYYARDEGWKDFYAYNALRAKFTDYFRYQYDRASQPAFDAAGWKEVDYWMLMNWFYADRDVYSLDHLRSISMTAPTTPLPTPGTVASGVLQTMPQFPALFQLMLAGLCVPLLTGGGWRQFALAFVLFGSVFAVILLMGVSGYWVPVRVAYPLFAGALAGSVLCPARVDPPKKEKRGGGAGGSFRPALRYGAGILAAGVVVWSFLGLSRADRDRVTEHQSTEQALRELKPRPDQLFVAWREFFPFEDLIFPLEDSAALRPFRCVSMSWVLPTPFTQRRLSEFGVADIYRAICDRPDVYVVTYPDLLHPLFTTYIRLHYGRNVVFHPTFLRPNKRTLLVFQSGEVRESAGPGANRPPRR